MIDALLAVKILKIAGIANIIFIVLIFFSCRCLVGSKIVRQLSKYGWYQKFYSKHCLLWWLFFVSVIIHTFLAFYLFGFSI